MRKRLIDFIGLLPTTNLRIVVTILITVGTAIRYWFSDTWIPDGDWLLFLTGSMGIDVVQFGTKRITQRGQNPTPDNPNTVG